MNRLYVIGDRKTGVLFLKTDPLRSAIIPSRAIRAYARAEKLTFEQAFGRIGAVAKFLTNKGAKAPKYPDNSPLFRAVGDLIAGGETMSDVDFCFVADLSAAAARGFSANRFSSARFTSARFSSARFSSAPIGDAIALLDDSAGAPGERIPVVGSGERRPKRAPTTKARKDPARSVSPRRR